MIAAAPLQADRDDALAEVMTYTCGRYDLPADAERDIRGAAMRLIEPILQLADHATVARVELEAIDRRLDNHVQHDHPECTAQRRCWRYTMLQIRRRKLQAAYDAAFRDLLRGHR